MNYSLVKNHEFAFFRVFPKWGIMHYYYNMPEFNDAPKPSVTTPEQKLSPDILTLRNKMREKTIDLMSIVAADGAILIGAAATLTPVFDMSEASFGVGTLAASLVVNVLQKGRLEYKHDKGAMKEDIINSEMGYAAMDLVYEGKDPLFPEEHGEEKKNVKKGDRLLIVSMPGVSKEEYFTDRKWVKGYEESQRAIFKDVLTHMSESGEDYKAVAISPPFFDVATEYMDASLGLSSVRELIQGKHNKIGKKREALGLPLILTPEQLQALTKDEHEVFMEGVKGLGNDMVVTLVEIAKNTHDPEEKKRVAQMLQKQLHAILKKECEEKLNGAEVKIMERTAEGVQVKERYERRLDMIKRSTGTQAIKLTGGDGYVETRSLERALGIEELTVLEMFTLESKFRKARTAYALERMVEDSGLDELLKEKPSDFNHGLEVMQEEGVHIIPRTTEELIAAMRSPGTYDIPKANIKSRIKAPLIAGALVGLSIGGSRYLDDIRAFDPSSIQQGVEAAFQKSENDAKTGEFRSTGEVPKTGLEWKVTTTNDDFLPTAGYYITDTAGALDNQGKWVITTQGEQNIQLPKVGDPNIPHITIERRQKGGKKDFKIPIRNSTEVSAISIRDDQGKEASFILTKYEDSTVGVHVDGSSTYFDIHAELVRSKNGPHAVKEIPSLDPSKLNSEALSLLENKNGTITKAEDVSKKYEYSLKENPKLKDAHTAEEIVNAIAESDACLCSTCNTLLALISPKDEETNTLNNVAFGFLNGVGNPASSTDSSFLRSESRHAFVVNSWGWTIDGTAQKIADDTATQDYMRVLQGGTVNPDEAWENAKNAMAQSESESQSNANTALLALTVAAAGGLTFYGSRRGYAGIRNAIAAGMPGQMWDKVVGNKLKERKVKIHERLDLQTLSLFSDAELSAAYGFFTKLSWSGGKLKDLNITPHEFEDVDKALDEMRENLNLDMVDEYLKSPKLFEKDWSTEQKVRTRALARRLLV